MQELERDESANTEDEFVSMDDLNELNQTKGVFERAQKEFSQAQAMLLKAQGAYEFKQSVIAQRYNIIGKDSVDLQSGKIIRNGSQ